MRSTGLLSCVPFSVHGPSIVALALACCGVVASSRALADPPFEAETAVAAGWRDSIERDIAHSEYRVTWQDETALDGLAGAHQAPNRAQNLRTYFTPDGIRVLPRMAHRTVAPAWEWGLALASWGRAAGGRQVQAAALRPHMRVDGNRVEYRRGDLVEWYVNDTRGLEQGFTLSRRPDAIASDGAAGESGPMRLQLVPLFFGMPLHRAGGCCSLGPRRVMREAPREAAREAIRRQFESVRLLPNGQLEVVGAEDALTKGLRRTLRPKGGSGGRI